MQKTTWLMHGSIFVNITHREMYTDVQYLTASFSRVAKYSSTNNIGILKIHYIYLLLPGKITAQNGKTIM